MTATIHHTKPESNKDDIAICVRGLTKKYSDNGPVILDNIDLDIKKNEFFTLLGPSGCGKTTLLRLIAGFEFPSTGQLLFNGMNLSNVPANKRPINTVFQSYALFPHMTVGQNVAFGLEMKGAERHFINQTVQEMLSLVRLTDLTDRYPSQLSGGQQQRVALARALAPKPEILLLDESLSALDHRLRKKMQEELKELQKKIGITFVFVTHDQEEALSMSDRIAVMARGHIAQLGTPQEIYEAPKTKFIAEFIGESNFLDVKILGIEETSLKITFGNLKSAYIRCEPAIASSFRKGDTAQVMVRPHSAELVADPQMGLMQGKISDVNYMGNNIQYKVNLDNGEVFVVSKQNLHRENNYNPTIGENAGVRFQDESLIFLR